MIDLERIKARLAEYRAQYEYYLTMERERDHLDDEPEAHPASCERALAFAEFAAGRPPLLESLSSDLRVHASTSDDCAVLNFYDGEWDCYDVYFEYEDVETEPPYFFRSKIRLWPSAVPGHRCKSKEPRLDRTPRTKFAKRLWDLCMEFHRGETEKQGENDGRG